MKKKAVICEICNLKCDGQEAWKHFKRRGHNSWTLIMKGGKKKWKKGKGNQL